MLVPIGSVSESVSNFSHANTLYSVVGLHSKRGAVRNYSEMHYMGLHGDYNGRLSTTIEHPPFGAVSRAETSKIADLGQGWNSFQVVGHDSVDQYGRDSFNVDAAQIAVPAAIEIATISARKGAERNHSPMR